MDEAGSGVASRPGGGLITRIIRRIDRALEIAEMTIIAGSVIAMALIMVIHVLGRTFFRIGIPGVTELTELLIILITFVGVSYAVRRARHISMSALYDQLTGMARKSLLVVICVVTGAMLFFLAWEAWGYMETIQRRGRTTSALNIPLWLIYIVLPIGFFLAGIQYWLTALRNLTTREMYRSFTEKEAYDDVPDELAGQSVAPTTPAEPEPGTGENAESKDDDATPGR